MPVVASTVNCCVTIFCLFCCQYSFYSEKHRRCEMAVLELYEGKEQNNATAFSSLSPPPNPLVLRQSYIFPVPVQRMASTVTEKGITNKNLISESKEREGGGLGGGSPQDIIDLY